jgi:hypothetical protein
MDSSVTEHRIRVVADTVAYLRSVALSMASPVARLPAPHVSLARRPGVGALDPAR